MTDLDWEKLPLEKLNDLWAYAFNSAEGQNIKPRGGDALLTAFLAAMWCSDSGVAFYEDGEITQACMDACDRIWAKYWDGPRNG